MRMVEVRARYAARQPHRGEALLGWQVHGAPPSEHEALHPDLGVAMRMAARLAEDSCCHSAWTYEGQRLYDAAAIVRRQHRAADTGAAASRVDRGT